MGTFVVKGNNQNIKIKDINQNIEIGPFFSNDRFYTLVNEFSDSNLKSSSKLLYFITCYFFRSSNYKHNTEGKKSKRKIIWLVDIFCWLCIIGFVVCLIAGIATPIIVAITSIASGKFVDIAKAWQEAFSSAPTIGVLITAIFCFIITVIYIYLQKKVVQVNKNLSLENYIIKKISLLNSMDYLIKSASIVNKSTNTVKNTMRIHSKKNDEPLIILNNLEILKSDQIWTILQMFNVMHKLFDNFNLALIFNDIDDDIFKGLEKIIATDFKNISINY